VKAHISLFGSSCSRGWLAVSAVIDMRIPWYAVFQALCDSGIATFTYDAEGFGLSEPLNPESRAFINDYHHMVGYRAT
jgi:hypothetical protein